MIILADMMMRPPFGDADLYIGAFVIGFILLSVVAAFVVRHCTHRSTRAAILTVAALISIIAGTALREEYHVSRAETCFHFLHGAAERGDKHGALIGYGRGGGRLVSIGPGYIRTKYGTPPELVAYLKRKYSGWFSGSIVTMRNAIFGFKIPTADKLSRVENMQMPPSIEEQLEMMEKSQQSPAGDVLKAAPEE